jgi:6-phosphogluconolactonase (cycloisomerase 2 family)
VYVTGKGGTNEISQFASLGSGALRPLTPPNVASGEFPYDIAVSPQGTSAYAVDNLSGTAGAVSQYTLNPATGKLTPMPPRKVAGAGFPIGIKVAPDGRYLYFVSSAQCLVPKGSTSSRCIALAKASTVSVFRISPATGALSSVPVQTLATGLGPQMITIAPDGRSAYVAATGASTIWQYSINPATGKLTPMSPASVATGKGPHDLAVAPDGKNLYVITVGDDTITQYAISPATGALSARPVSTAATVPAPEAIALSPDGKNAYVTSEGRGRTVAVRDQPRDRQDHPLVTGHRHRAVPRLTRRGGHPLTRSRPRRSPPRPHPGTARRSPTPSRSPTPARAGPTRPRS